MSLGWLQLAGLLGLPLVAGIGVLARMRLPLSCARLAWLAWAWVAGLLVLGLFLYAWVLAEAPLARAPLAFGAIALALFASGLRKLKASASAPLEDTVARAPTWERWLWRASVFAILALAVSRVAASAAIPVLEGDEANYWTLRAKLLWQHGGISAGFLADSVDTELIYHPAYPFFNSLLQLWSFCWAGGIDAFAARIAIVACGPALWLALAGLLARVARPCVGAVLLWITATLPLTQSASRFAESDLLSALGMVVALDGWLRVRADRGEGWRVLALGCAFFLWSKNEGALWIAAALAGTLVAAFLPGGARFAVLRPRRAWLWALVPALFVALTAGYNAYHGFSNDLTSGDYRGKGMLALLVEQFPERTAPVLAWFAKHVWFDRDTVVVYVALLAVLVARPAWIRRRELNAPVFALLFASAGLVLVYVATPHPIPQHLETSAHRVAWTLFPVAIVLLARATEPERT
ncbi:MAG: hypothetical protein EPO68_00625 [Planctomycetota bacterium]|nr:MAG: hypothetical protein EPO68_00625 [Planctomycetota bacterium]